MRQLIVLIGAWLATGIALAVPKTLDDPESAWQEYLARDTSTEPRYRFPHASCFRAASVAYGLPETLLLAVARGESDFEPTARSKANAHGVMQILWPTTANHLGIYRLSELYDPCTNIDAGARYLKEMLGRFDGNLHLALAAYNYGPERIAANPDDIPDGANWYSGYIYRHLDYVLGDGNSNPTAVRSLYSELGQSTLVEFGEPYRAAAFVKRLEATAPDVQLDWFRKDVGRFAVIMRYTDREQFDRHAGLLSRVGFPIQ
jgi:hypothetical protein